MSNSPPSVLKDPVPSIDHGATLHTPPDPTVVVDTLLGSRANHYRPSKPTTNTMATAVANQQSTLLRDPMPPTIAAVPQFVSGAQTYTPPDPNVAVAAPLGTTTNRCMHSSPTTLATAVASNYLTMATPFRHPSPPTIAAIPPIGPIRGAQSMRLEKQGGKESETEGQAVFYTVLDQIRIVFYTVLQRIRPVFQTLETGNIPINTNNQPYIIK